MEVICERIAERVVGWKSVRSCRSVMRSVLDGGVGWVSGGRLEMSRERVGREECEDVRLEVECGGEEDMMVVFWRCLLRS